MALLIGLAAALVTVLGFSGARMLRTTGLEEVEEGMRTTPVAQRERGFGAFLDRLGSLFLGTTMRAYGPARLRRLEETIRRAGRPDGLTLTVYLRRQAAFVVIGVVGLVVFLLVGQPWTGLLLLLLLCGWMRLWLMSAGRRRQEQIDMELPDFLDVLGVTVTAGLGFRQAVERVCEFHTGPLAEEMRTVLQEMSVGISRRQAFIAMRDRTRSDGVAAFVTALLQAEELGVPLSSALDDIASDVRKEHAQRVRQAAAKAAPKVSLVVTMTIVPGTLILIGSSILLANREVLSGIF
ncbi:MULTISPECIES: type II secretion system F family protein [Cellulomonas]|jgi:tight adherence protein C|uniref:Tight adherence protein C n=1 Tax=Cellulomonas iranensis TaxID=76862 RepID=A0ABU0GLS8_9CELL|nr:MULTISPECIES: type II secretion system F family protein [Cellulomonas]MBO9567783.1 type II secretion system F family protein [Cellulomonas iranensis]MDQ0426315.1 tight adherence protein C [Cellulomonas iranensis]TFH73992.1 type II secretion system F family protein [Cellulomonas sp. HD19AZ1]UCN15722.1 type II secretion system F family protein [Cellulomonas iranensis]